MISQACSSYHQITIWICFWFSICQTQPIYKKWDGNAVLSLSKLSCVSSVPCCCNKRRTCSFSRYSHSNKISRLCIFSCVITMCATLHMRFLRWPATLSRVKPAPMTCQCNVRPRNRNYYIGDWWNTFQGWVWNMSKFKLLVSFTFVFLPRYAQKGHLCQIAPCQCTK